MTRLTQSFESGTLAALSTSNPSGDTPFNTVTVAGGSSAVDSTHASQGTKSVKITPTSGTVNNFRWTGLTSTAFGASFYIWMDTLSSVETWICNTTAGGTRAAMLVISSTNKLRLIDTRGVGTPVWTATNTFPTSQWVRVEMYFTVNASTATQSVAYYLGDSTTATDSFTSSAGQTGSTAVDTVIFGKADSGTYASAFWFDGIQAETAASGLLGPWVTQLTTPTVSSGTLVNPTTSVSTDGSVVISWSAVSNATSYEAWKATKASPLQSDFTLVATGVTSPYTVTGLSAASSGTTYSLGIKAKA